MKTDLPRSFYFAQHLIPQHARPHTAGGSLSPATNAKGAFDHNFGDTL